MRVVLIKVEFSVSSKVDEMKSPIRYEENDFFITEYFYPFPEVK